MANDLKILAIDLDGTLCEEVCWTSSQCLEATPVEAMIAKMRKITSGKIIVIYTARKDHLIPATLKWLRKHNVPYHSFSNNKIPADFYIDDHAITPEDWLKEKEVPGG